ncbi:MipA/OmpV family protein [Microbulbifer sp. GL-2]|uniref:MipA/OmpV family protein n=1 Tax=Microbulbifer sp. GL-2 TaxID=2591606 RepID=UPI0011651D91|nr:MipA/OmpV family protein [Microbulbifer sp. GL-2]BBM03473.1 structural protein MipA [Microbulbifer sp. GL-2]
MIITREKRSRPSFSDPLAICVAFYGVILSHFAWAEEGVKQSAEQVESSFSLGIGAFSSESIYVGGKDQHRVLPLLSGHYKRFYFQGFELGADLYRNSRVRVKLGIGGDFTGDKDRGDSDNLDDMKELDIAVLANLSMNYRSPIGLWTFGLAQDISNTHGGYKVSAGYGFPYGQGSWFIKPELNVSWRSENALDYYYGVDADEATSNRVAYKVNADIATKLSLQVGYLFSPKLMLMGGINQTLYGDEIMNSPIVATDSSSRALLMLNYKF